MSLRTTSLLLLFPQSQVCNNFHFLNTKRNMLRYVNLLPCDNFDCLIQLVLELENLKSCQNSQKYIFLLQCEMFGSGDWHQKWCKTLEKLNGRFKSLNLFSYNLIMRSKRLLCSKDSC